MNSKLKSGLLFGVKVTLFLIILNIVLYRPLTEKTIVEIVFSSTVAGILGGLFINPLKALFPKLRSKKAG